MLDVKGFIENTEYGIQESDPACRDASKVKGPLARKVNRRTGEQEINEPRIDANKRGFSLIFLATENTEGTERRQKLRYPAKALRRKVRRQNTEYRIQRREEDLTYSVERLADRAEPFDRLWTGLGTEIKDKNGLTGGGFWAREPRWVQGLSIDYRLLIIDYLVDGGRFWGLISR